MTSHGLSLEDISEATGVERRTLRSWVAEGLLAPPLKTGRGATYPATNVDRALAVRALQDVHGMKLVEIRTRLMRADEAQIRAWAVEGRQPPRRTSARDYLRDLNREHRGPTEEPLHAPRAAPWPEAEDALPERPRVPGAKTPRAPDTAAIPRDLAGIEALAHVLEAAARVPPGRRGRASTWVRIPITPDLELMARGELSPPDRATLERISITCLH